MNKELLIDTLKHIKNNPDAFNMDHWVYSGKLIPRLYEQVEAIRSGPSCGTTMCLAGWVCHVATAQGQQWPITGDEKLYLIDAAAYYFLELAPNCRMRDVFFSNVETFEELLEALQATHYLSEQDVEYLMEEHNG